MSHESDQNRGLILHHHDEPAVNRAPALPSLETETHQITPDESMRPYLTGDSAERYDWVMSTGSGIELLPRLFEGPFPTADEQVRMQVIQGLPRDINHIYAYIRALETDYQVGSWHIFQREPSAELADEKLNEAGKSYDGKWRVLHCDDPIFEYLDSIGPSLSKDILGMYDNRGDTIFKVPSGASMADVIVYWNEHILSDAKQNLRSCNISEVFQPSMGQFIFERKNGTVSAEVEGGGASPAALSLGRLERIASSTFSGVEFFNQAAKNKVKLDQFNDKTFRESFMHESGNKAWAKMRPHVVNLMLTQGYQKDYYSPYGWHFEDEATQEMITYDEWVERMWDRLPTEYRKPFEDFVRVNREKRILLENYLGSGSVAPSNTDVKREDVQLALVALTADPETGRALVGVPQTLTLSTGERWETDTPDGIINTLLDSEAELVAMVGETELSQEALKKLTALVVDTSHPAYGAAKALLERLDFSFDAKLKKKDFIAQHRVTRKTINLSQEKSSFFAPEEWQKAQMLLDSWYMIALQGRFPSKGKKR